MVTKGITEELDLLSGESTEYQARPSGASLSDIHARNRATGMLLNLASDVAAIIATAALVLYARFSWPGLFSPEPVSQVNWQLIGEHLGFIVLYSTLVMLLGDSYGMYGSPKPDFATEVTLLAKTIGFASVLLILFIFLTGTKKISRAVVLGTASANFVAVAATRYGRRRWISRRVEVGYHSRNVLIVGANKIGHSVERHLRTYPLLGYNVVGFLDRHSSPDLHVLGDMESMEEVVRRYFVDEILIAVPWERDLVRETALRAVALTVDVRVLTDSYDGLAWAQVDYVGYFPAIPLHVRSANHVQFRVKRVLDMVGAAAGLVLLFPLFCLIAVCLKFDSDGPAFYRSARIGRKGREFECYKFRSMKVNAEEMKQLLQHRNERSGVMFKLSNDPRVTRVGRFLRKYSLDELPQLWNVLRGEMSLVGPRPPLPSEVTQYELNHLQRLAVLPGLTGLWQVEARKDPSFETCVNLDLSYVQNWSVWLDLKILLRTFKVVLQGTGQ